MRNLTSDGANLKILSEGTGNGIVPARVGNDFQYDRIIIPHGYSSDVLTFQVGVRAGGATYYAPLAALGSFYVMGYIDATNLYIEVGDGSAVDEAAIPFTYHYRVLIP